MPPFVVSDHLILLAPTRPHRFWAGDASAAPLVAAVVAVEADVVPTATQHSGRQPRVRACGARGGVGSGPPCPGARDREPRADDRPARFVASEHGSHPGDDESYTDA